MRVTPVVQTECSSFASPALSKPHTRPEVILLVEIRI